MVELGVAVRVPAKEPPKSPVSPEAVRVPAPFPPKSPVSPEAVRVPAPEPPKSPVSPEAVQVPAPESSPESPINTSEPALKPSSLKPTAHSPLPSPVHLLSPAIPSPHPGLPNHRADLRGLLYLLVSCAAALLTCPAGSAVVQAALPSNPASIPSVHLRFPFSCDSVSPPLT
ncbi:unnamed protein product [Gadus morhua 'NCC']